MDNSEVPESKEEQVKKAMTISTSRILTQEDFRILQQRQAAKEAEGLKTGGKKRKRENEEEEQERCEFCNCNQISADIYVCVHVLCKHQSNNTECTLLHVNKP